MSFSDSRIAAQIRSLDASVCIRDLADLHHATQEIVCDSYLLRAPDGFAFNVVLRHRANIGENAAYEFRSVCVRQLSFAQPAYRCPVCFDIILDFLSSRTLPELLASLGSEPTVIAIFQETAPFTKS